MERNWLIRTTQKQILGPVAKSKVLEFLQKGALGINDEVTSGNGYWFSLKEKDLVDKYLFGDIPQGYNPISESKSVLSKRENPDKTTSLNAAPVNHTQVIKLTPGLIPSSTELEYPDITTINMSIGAELTQSPTNATPASPVATPKTPITPSTPLPLPSLASLEESKLPASEDLEFPDVSLIRAAVNQSPSDIIKHAPSVEIKSTSSQKIEVKTDNEPMVYPVDDDLAYPDLESMMETTSPPVIQEIIEEEREFKLELAVSEKTPPVQEVKKEVANDFKNETRLDSKLTLSDSKAKHEKAEAAQSLKKEPPAEDKKLLHERKVKASVQIAASREAAKPPQEMARTALPEHLKKRNDNYLMYILVILVLIILSLFFYYYRTILNKPLPV